MGHITNLIVCSQVINLALCIYFHELSYTTLVAKGKAVEDDFGFSLGYQRDNANLVIGAPNSDRYGKVYTCSLNDSFISNTLQCTEVDMDFKNLTPDTVTDNNPDQKFMLGASIAATSNYFLTSAPLWTGALKKMTEEVPYNLVYGTCLVYANGTSNRCKGPYEKALQTKTNELQTIAGGIGWKTFVDEVDNLILISKPSTPPFKGTMLHINIEKPLDPMRKLSIDLVKEIIKQNFRYFGMSITSGDFFNTSQHVYAVSTRDDEMYGKILFLKYNTKKHYLTFLKQKRKLVTIKDSGIGTMFGVALCGSDLNKDGLSELLVGAPAHSEDRTDYDTGAVHIYLGGPQETIQNLDRKRTIFGINDGSRFGSTIATNDLDGDGIPEIFVSAPNENFGTGALYVMVGHEIYNELLKLDGYKEILLSKLNLMQRIQNEHFRYFGHSIQVLPDLDNNGCDELVIGAPSTQNAMLLRCIPQIHVSITSELVGAKMVKEHDNNFTINVCVNVMYYTKVDKIYNELVVTNNIIGEKASIDGKQRMYTIDLSKKKEIYCENVIVKLYNNEEEDYRFYAQVSMDEKNMLNVKEFNKNWVMLSSNSKLEAKVLDIYRHCTGDECLPSLSTTLFWSGSTSYVVESAQNESITVRVHNSGHSSYKACLLISVKGAQVAQIGCGNHDGDYLCYLPNPLKMNADHVINITLNMWTLTSMKKYINTSVLLFQECPEPFLIGNDESKYIKSNLSVTLSFKKEDIILKGSTHNVTITDKEILDKEKETFNATHEYSIINRGFVTWENVDAVLTVNKMSHVDISGFRVSTIESLNCKLSEVVNGIITCKFNLLPNSTIILKATVPVLNNKIVENLVHNSMTITTTLSLNLYPASTALEMGSTTTVIFQKELSLAQNKTLIIIGATLLAAIILMLIAFILYKLGFFKRKQKEVLKEHIRRKSIKQSTNPHDGEPEGITDLNLELEDDAFECHDVTSDNALLHQPGTSAKVEVNS